MTLFHDDTVGIMYAKPTNAQNTTASTATTAPNGLRTPASLPVKASTTYTAAATMNTPPTTISFVNGERPMPAMAPMAASGFAK